MAVYFIQEASEAKRIKIGFSASDPVGRIRALRTSSAYPLTLLVTIPGGAKEESALHARFKDLRRHLEWFEPAPRLLGFIEALTVMHPDQPVDDGRTDEATYPMDSAELFNGLRRSQLFTIYGFVEACRVHDRCRVVERSIVRDESGTIDDWVNKDEYVEAIEVSDLLRRLLKFIDSGTPFGVGARALYLSGEQIDFELRRLDEVVVAFDEQIAEASATPDLAVPAREAH